MEEKVGVMLAVSGQNLVEDECQNGLSLCHITERSRSAGVQLFELGAQQEVENLPGFFDFAQGEEFVGIAPLLLKARIGLAEREIDVAQQRLEGYCTVQVWVAFIHRDSSSTCIGVLWIIRQKLDERQHSLDRVE